MVVGVVVSTILFYGWVYWVLGINSYPRTVFVFDGVLLIGLLAGVRLPSRIFHEHVMYRKKKKVLVVGAGDSGERVVREMKTRSEYRRQPIGFVDDQLSLVNQRIHGVRVLGTLGISQSLWRSISPKRS